MGLQSMSEIVCGGAARTMLLPVTTTTWRSMMMRRNVSPASVEVVWVGGCGLIISCSPLATSNLAAELGTKRYQGNKAGRTGGRSHPRCTKRVTGSSPLPDPRCQHPLSFDIGSNSLTLGDTLAPLTSPIAIAIEGRWPVQGRRTLPRHLEGQEAIPRPQSTCLHPTLAVF
jgi:hypothetical protein